MTNCISRTCGKPFDSSIPETRNTATLRSFWQRYCPECRTKGNADSPVIVETRQCPIHTSNGPADCEYCTSIRSLQTDTSRSREVMGRSRKAKLRPVRVFHYRGGVERGIGGSYEWRDGYSENSEDGLVLYPWNTRHEIRRDGAKQGFKAVFYRDGKPEVTR